MEVHLPQHAFPVQLANIVDWDSHLARHVKKELSIHLYNNHLSHRVLPVCLEATVANLANRIVRIVLPASTAI